MIFKKSLIALAVLSIMGTAQASIVRSDVNYSIFRDFAENKGKFTPGASNIEIFTKSKESLGMMMENIPMVDFSATTIGGPGEGRARGTLIDPQYIVSVEHNTGYYSNVNFGSLEPHRDDLKFHYKLANMHQRTPRTHLGSSAGGTDKVSSAEDYQTPKLIRMVTEVVPASLPENTDFAINKDTFTAIVRRGSGDQGRDIIQDNNGELSQIRNKDPLHGGPYLTGGSVLPLASQGYHYQKDKVINFRGHIWESYNGPLISHPQKGDSGSAIFSFDKASQKWVVLAVAQSVDAKSLKGSPNPYWNYYTLTTPADFEAIKEDYAKDNKAVINNTEEQVFTIKNNVNPAQATITANDNTVTTLNMYDASKGGTAWDKSLPAYDAGRDLTFSGEKGKLLLDGNMDQGAGGLYFDTDFTVDGKVVDSNKPLWSGAGVVVAKDKTVDWNLAASRDDDRMSKLGQGTLVLAPTIKKGNHLGQISVGDGTVELDFHSEDNSKANLMVGIVSGRPTVKIKNAQALDTKKITFGFRGGKLDMNGNDLNFERIRHIDTGATIINNNSSQTATLTLTGLAPKTLDQLISPNKVDQFSSIANKDGELYDYYLQRAKHWINYPNDKSSYNWNGNEIYVYDYSQVPTTIDRDITGFNAGAKSLENFTQEGWVKLGKIWNSENVLLGGGQGIDTLSNDKKEILKKALPYVNFNRLLTNFSGFFGNRDGDAQGQLDIVYNPSTTEDRVFFTGGSNTTGDLTIEKGHLTLQGAPVVHADDHQNSKVLTFDDDYINPNFKFKKVVVKNGSEFQIGRNVNQVTTDIELQDNSIAILGYSKQDKAFLVNTAYGGAYDNTDALTDKGYEAMPITKIRGNIISAENSTITIGSRAHLIGHINNGSKTGTDNDGTNSDLTIKEGGKWTLTGDSNLRTLNLEGGDLVLNNHNPYSRSAMSFNTLTVDALKANNSKVNNVYYSTDYAQAKNDKIVVKEKLKGNLHLHINNTGLEPTSENDLELIKLENNATKEDLTIHLNENNTVDFGAYRYSLEESNNLIHLQSQLTPEAEAEAKQKAEEEAKQKAEKEAKQKAEEEAKQKAEEEAKQKAEEEAKQKAEEEAKQKAEEEAKQKAEEETKQKPKPNQSEYISRYSNAALSENSAWVNNIFQIEQGLNEVYLAQQQDGIDAWVRYEDEKTENSSENYRQYDQHSYLTQVGAKYTTNGWTMGALLSQSTANNHYADNMEGDLKITQGNLFLQRWMTKDFSLSADVGLEYSKHTLDGENNTVRRTVSPQIGLNLAKSWILPTQIQLQTMAGVRYHYLPAYDYELNGAKVKSSRKNLVTYHMNIAANKTFIMNSFAITPEVSFGYINAHHKNTLRVNNATLQQEFDDRIRLAGGVKLQTGAFAVKTQWGKTWGKQFKAKPFMNITLQYHW